MVYRWGRIRRDIGCPGCDTGGVVAQPPRDRRRGRGDVSVVATVAVYCKGGRRRGSGTGRGAVGMGALLGDDERDTGGDREREHTICFWQVKHQSTSISIGLGVLWVEEHTARQFIYNDRSGLPADLDQIQTKHL
jgi:hypothetical protein